MDTLTTGQFATELGMSEVRLNELIRRRKVTPPPKVNGRRRWTPKARERARTEIGRNA